ncbi:MAG: hypothetical protein KBA46_01430 [Candidatus Omnitrophica bacterium]|nr:hypothetical protein [Candidatus Omnitrophota bacterium]
MKINKFLCVASVILLAGANYFVWAGPLTSGEAGERFKEGVKAQKEHNYTNANVFYQKVFLLDPGNKDYKKFITNNFGLMMVEQGDLDRAEAAFREVLAQDPSYKPAQINLGLVIDKQGDRLKSLEYWASLFKWEEMKPKDFILQETVK